MLMQLLKQQLHQRFVVQNPTDGALVTVARGQVLSVETNPPCTAGIAQIQCGKARQRRF